MAKYSNAITGTIFSIIILIMFSWIFQEFDKPNGALDQFLNIPTSASLGAQND